jgi:hypothetical protein
VLGIAVEPAPEPATSTAHHTRFGT